MIFFPSFIKKFSYGVIIIFSYDKDLKEKNYKISYITNFSIGDDQIELLKLRSRIEKFLSNFDTKKSFYSNKENFQDENVESVEILFLDEHKKIKISTMFNFLDITSEISFKDDHDKELTYNIETETLYKNLENFYFYLNFRDQKFLLNQLPQEFKNILRGG